MAELELAGAVRGLDQGCLEQLVEGRKDVLFGQPGGFRCEVHLERIADDGGRPQDHRRLR
jgi:hypothetical protein